MGTTKGQLLPLAAHEDGSITAMYTDGKGAAPVNLKPAVDGAPIMSDYMYAVSPREGSPVADVEVIALTGKGPPKVNTEAYRQGWDRIFRQAAGEDASEADQLP